MNDETNIHPIKSDIALQEAQARIIQLEAQARITELEAENEALKYENKALKFKVTSINLRESYAQRDLVTELFKKMKATSKYYGEKVKPVMDRLEAYNEDLHRRYILCSMENTTIKHTTKKQQERIDELEKLELEGKPLGVRERETLLEIILALFDSDNRALANKPPYSIGQTLEERLGKLGISKGSQTIANKIQEALELKPES